MSKNTDIEKLASQIPVIHAEAAQMLRKLANDNVSLEEDLASARRELQNMKIARRMEQRGLEPNLSFEEKVAKVAAVEDAKLASLEGAVEMAAGGFRLGQLDESRASEKTAARGELYHASEGGDELEGFVSNMSAYD